MSRTEKSIEKEKLVVVYGWGEGLWAKDQGVRAKAFGVPSGSNERI